jgi:hypothetical protein
MSWRNFLTILLRGWLLDPGGREGLREVKITFY